VVFLLIEFPLRQQKFSVSFTFPCAYFFLTLTHTLVFYLEVNFNFSLVHPKGINTTKTPQNHANLLTTAVPTIQFTFTRITDKCFALSF